MVDYDEGRIIPRSNRTSRDQMYGFSSITVPEFVEELSVVVPALLATGYVLMVLYCAAAFFKCDSMQSRCGVGLVRDHVSDRYITFTYLILDGSVYCYTRLGCCSRNYCLGRTEIHRVHNSSMFICM